MNRRDFVRAALSAPILAGIRAPVARAAQTPAGLQNKEAAAPVNRDGIWFDSLGLIVQRDGDGGDTAQREGMYWFGNWARIKLLGIQSYGAPRSVNFAQVMALLEDGQTGSFRRHPRQDKWKDPSEMSRDQMIPLIAAMGVNRDFARLDRFRDRLQKIRYFLNKDNLLFYEEFIKRALDRDLQLNGETDKVILDKAVDLRLQQSRDDLDDVGDDLNLIVQLLLAAVRRGKKIDAVRARYSRDRAKNYGVYLTRYRQEFPNDVKADKKTMVDRIERGIKTADWKPDCTAVVGILKWYFRPETGGSPGLADLYEPLLVQYFGAPIPS